MLRPLRRSSARTSLRLALSSLGISPYLQSESTPHKTIHTVGCLQHPMLEWPSQSDIVGKGTPARYRCMALDLRKRWEFVSMMMTSFGCRPAPVASLVASRARRFTESAGLRSRLGGLWGRDHFNILPTLSLSLSIMHLHDYNACSTVSYLLAEGGSIRCG